MPAEPGAKNAAVLAVQILALSDEGLAEKLTEFKKLQEKKWTKRIQRCSELHRLRKFRTGIIQNCGKTGKLGINFGAQVGFWGKNGVWGVSL